MKAPQIHWFSRTFLFFVLVLSIVGLSLLIRSRSVYGQEHMLAIDAIEQRLQARPAIPFMHRPYYGSRTILQRTVSFVDHDKPWYVADHLVVRYDGHRFTGGEASIASCSPGASCYDGHNGYDLNMRFEPVLSAAAGRVIRANWYNPLDHNSSLGMWVAIDHGNGFLTAYGHLSALTVSVGDYVGAQWQVGTSGTTGASTGPHLHMATYYAPYWLPTDPFGWTGHYSDPNVVPDNYLWVNEPGTVNSVPNLSSSGRVAYPSAVVVDDGGAGWSSTGQWHSAGSGTAINGSLHWAATTSAGVSATATWRPIIPVDGNYEVAVFVDDSHASSSWVPYSVYSAEPNRPGIEVRHTVYVDESHIGRFQGPFGTVATGPQWVSIGTYYFRAAMNGRVTVSNATGEEGQQIAGDGIEFERIGNGAGQPASSAPVRPAPAPTPTSSASLKPTVVATQPVPTSTAAAAGSPQSGVPTTVVKTYYFAEGYTGMGTSENLVLTNLATKQANIAITYLYQNAARKTVTYQIGGQARRVLNINQEAGSDQSVSMIVQGDQWFTAERTMYTHKGSFIASGESFGTSTLSNNWFFAEGNTTAGWNTLLAALNPSASPITLRVTTLPTKNGASKTLSYVVPAFSRTTVVFNNDLPNEQFGMVINASGALAVERAEYLVEGPQQGGNAVVGALSPQRTWYFGRGEVGATERLILAAPLTGGASVRVRYLLTNGQVVTQNVNLQGLSRSEIDLSVALQQTCQEMVISASAPIVAERQTFFATSFNGAAVGSTAAIG